MSEPADGVMTCERASDLLVDLACDELSAELTAAVRAHAQGCGRCGPELAKLTRVLNVAETLPLSEPSRAVEDRIMRAAREALAARAGGTQAQEPGRSGPEQRGWFARLAEWALSPQVAMASVLLLMVGIGLYALPIGRDQEHVAFEAAPDERAPAGAPAAAASAVAVQESEEAAEQPRAREQAFVEKESSAATKGISEFKPAASSKALRVRAGGVGKSGGNIAEPAPSSFAPAPPAANAPARPSASKAESAAAPAPEMLAEARSPGDDLTVVRAQKSLSDGIAAARRGAYAQAVSLLSPLADEGPESVRASARLWLARSLRGQGKCVEALRFYGPIVQQSKVTDDVLNEAADCYERTGETARAGQLRARLGAQE